MKKLWTIILIVSTFWTANAQLEATIDPVHPTNVAAMFSVPVGNDFYVGIWGEGYNQEKYWAAGGDIHFKFAEIGNNFKVKFINGFQVGAATDGWFTSYYFAESMFWKDFPLGIKLYQRISMSNYLGVYYENRVGIVWNFMR